MNVDRARRGFLIGGAALAAVLLAGRGVIADDRSSRKITVYKNPT